MLDSLFTLTLLRFNQTSFSEDIMEPTFQGKRALVTGAGKAIGRAVAIKLASLGANVVGLSRTQSDLDSLKVECPSIEICYLDIADWDIARETIERLGHFDLLVNNAAIYNTNPFLDVTKEELDSIHNINFKAAFNITQIVARSIVAKETGGSVVNISSVAGLRALPNRSGYCVAKAALDMLTKTLALELGPHQIRVNSVNPTLVYTTRVKEDILANPGLEDTFIAGTPLGRIAEEKDIVNAVVFLLSDQASMVNGVIMPVDGGLVVKCL